MYIFGEESDSTCHNQVISYGPPHEATFMEQVPRGNIPTKHKSSLPNPKTFQSNKEITTDSDDEATTDRTIEA